MRDMGRRPHRWTDLHLTRVSSSDGRIRVRNQRGEGFFGAVGRSHRRFTRAAEDFSRFYRDWVRSAG